MGNYDDMLLEWWIFCALRLAMPSCWLTCSIKQRGCICHYSDLKWVSSPPSPQIRWLINCYKKSVNLMHIPFIFDSQTNRYVAAHMFGGDTFCLFKVGVWPRGMQYKVKSILRSMLVSKSMLVSNDFQIWLLIGWRLYCQTNRWLVWKPLLIDMDFNN